LYIKSIVRAFYWEYLFRFLLNKLMLKEISTSEFNKNIGKHSQHLLDEKDYIVVANSKSVDKSFVVINLNVFRALLGSSSFKSEYKNLDVHVKDLYERVRNKYSRMGVSSGAVRSIK